MFYQSISYNFNFKENVLAFDLDYTIIKPKSGKKFPINENDWKFIFDSKKKLIELSKDNSIIFITNQLGISKGKSSIESLNNKLDSIQKILNIPLLVFISPNDDIYRKPSLGSYQYILNNYKLNDKKIKKFDYIGDAAGRKNDHSDSDYKFLLNIKKYNEINNLNIKSNFYTPEEFFENKNNQTKNILNYQLNYTGHQKFKDILNITKKYSNKTVFLITGYPASGKTHLSKKLSENLNIGYFSKDKDKSKFKTLVKKYLNENENKNLIVEGLYYSDKQKNELINLVNDYKIINLYLDVDLDTSFHMNIYRSNNFKVKKIPKVVYYTFRKNYTHDDRFIKYSINPIIEDNNINKFYLN